ncbi:hypothetical protein [Streptomyces tsukubensis]|uniref:DUF4034 domain-containing protein n=1 Tax=Streptomyces tsukubensis TaxID=83656 RepID=A0A1V3ZZW5_9ACTN|nr:hypothetical protein [Streptomyces tsukubensis]OON71757.1 hypothetical protein B1H18_32715 [Streptomyces tsukubensis]QFR93106.1 hypothetical protein GBW32_08480 [Streptomyces tsukubensis]
MSPLHALIRTLRMIRHTPQLAVGLTPDDEILLDAPDSRTAPALVAAGRGEYEPAAKLLATTREHAEWEARDRCTALLAAFARLRPEWFELWQEASPHDPDVLLVKAELAVQRGWESPARAELLREVTPLIAAAADGDRRDPVPWRVALDHARGTNAPHTAFELLWEQAVRRASHHYGCHVAALRYLSAAWYGSHRECFDFAERAADDTPADSLVQALPVRAALAYLTEDASSTLPDTAPGQVGAVSPLGAERSTTAEPGSVERPRLDAAADRAIRLSGQYAAADAWPAQVRNILVYVLVRLERWDDALAQLRVLGPHATSFPWDRISDDPLAQFLELRDGIRLEIAARAPLWSPRGRLRPKDH